MFLECRRCWYAQRTLANAPSCTFESASNYFRDACSLTPRIIAARSTIVKSTTDDSKARTDLCLASSRSVPAWQRYSTELEALSEGGDPIKVVDVSVHTAHHG